MHLKYINRIFALYLIFLFNLKNSKIMFAIRKDNTNQNNPEEKGNLKKVYLTYSEASKDCKEGYYVCNYTEPK